MAVYPRIEGERRFGAATLQSVVTRTFAGCGLSHADAGLLARSLVHADLRGIHSHGVLRVPDYVAKLTVGGVNPRGRPTVVKDDAAAIVVDGGNSMGQIAGDFAMRQAIDRARSSNVAFVAVRGSNHCGALDFYTLMAVAEDMIGIAATNALPTMAPWGGTAKIVGLNPLSVSIPAGAERPIVLDMALGATSHGKIRVYAQKSEPIPRGWAFDKDGRETTDARAALDGLIQPLGQFKGIGLSLVFGVLSTVLGGAAYGTGLGNMVDGPRAGADGHFFMAIRVAAFEDISRFRARIDDIVREFQTSPTAPGYDRVYVPGAIEAMIAAENERLGIPLNEETVAGIVQAAQRLGVDPGPLMPATGA